MPRLAGGVSALALVAGLTLMFIYKPWLGSAEPPAPVKKGDSFASDRGPGAAAAPVAIDAKRTMGYLDSVCAIGPRVSGTDGMKKQQELLAKHFKDLGGAVSWQRFTARQRSQGRPVDMANLVVSWHADRPRRVILCSHYDTRPIADQENDPRRWREPFLSANDGGSGVALLMELAHHMKDLPTAVGIDFVFFDGEEYVFAREGEEYFFGSKHFGREYRTKRGKDRYLAAVLLDMIAGKDPRFPVEPQSAFRAGPLVKEIWDIAAEWKCAAFRRDEYGRPVDDDHIALNNAGIPAIDIIDFDYAHWHHLSDVPANCSSEGMEQVSRVLTVWLQRVR